MEKYIKFFVCLIICVMAYSAKAQEENGIIVCDNGLEMFQWDLDFIREAKYSIDMAPC